MNTLSLYIDGAGWCPQAEHIPSPNQDARPAGMTIDMVVLHNIHLPPAEHGELPQFGGDDIIRLFTNTLDPAAHPAYAALAGVEVSAHFLLRRDGALIQFVSCNARAWHAGKSVWQGREGCNAFSIGIELEGADFVPFTDAQYARLNQLLPALAARYPLLHLVGHSDIAPGRKTDPGPCFDWLRIDALPGVAVRGS